MSYFDDRLEFRLTNEELKMIKKIVKKNSFVYQDNVSIFIRSWIKRGINHHKMSDAYRINNKKVK